MSRSLCSVTNWRKYAFRASFIYTRLLKQTFFKSTVKEIEKLADKFNSSRSPETYKRALVKNIPRRAVLKPVHAVYRLQNQQFTLGDRVIMVQDSGAVPLSIKGVVIGINAKNMDIVWDVPFMSGTTLGNRHAGFFCYPGRFYS